jgi:hypothetical protein
MPEPQIQQAEQSQNAENLLPVNLEILMDPRFEEVTKSDLRQVIQEALEILANFTEAYLVEEDFALVALKTAARTGSYIGKWEGKHNIMATVSGREAITNPKERISLVLTICHELLHQKFAEILGLTDPNGTDIDAKLQHELLQSKSDFERAEILAFSGMADASFLQKALNEGFAVYGELQLLKALLSSGDLIPEERAVILEFVEERLRDITEEKERPSTYRDGHTLITGLLKRFKETDLLEVVARIDWKGCSRIKSDSAQYNAILQDPSVIPGIVRPSV